MRALSGLTPALSRRLQQQLLAHLPPAAARSLRRTLSLHAPAARADRAAAAAAAAHSVPATPLPDTTATSDAPRDPGDNHPPPEAPASRDTSPKVEREDSLYDSPASQYCTLPRLKRPTVMPRETTPPEPEPPGTDTAARGASQAREPSQSRGSVRSTPDRPLLSKYLTPERALSLDDSYSSDGGSILSEPSYVAAYGAPAVGGSAALGFRRHSMRLAGDQPRKRISRFLRPDFFDTPPDENVYAKHKKEKELETQKILKEIREKKNRSFDSSSTPRSPTDSCDSQYTFKDDSSYPRKCLSPISVLTAKERSRSNTPFFPSLDNIKESAIDTSSLLINDTTKPFKELTETKQKSRLDENASTKDSRLTRPKSYPVKNLESIEEPIQNLSSECYVNKENESKEKNLQKESKLIRPKSYPTSSPSPEKLQINRNTKKQETLTSNPKEVASPEVKNDVEVSFNITLPKKTKLDTLTKADSLKNSESLDPTIDNKMNSNKMQAANENLKKYKVISNVDFDKSHNEIENGSAINEAAGINNNTSNIDSKVISNTSKKEDIQLKTSESETPIEKKGTIKKKIIRKVSSKSKTDLGSQDNGELKSSTEKKKVTKKVKEKASEDGAKPTVTKKKSVLQSIGQKLEKFASTKSASPEKFIENNDMPSDLKKITTKESRVQREQSVPVDIEPPTESNLIKRAVTLTDVAALDTQNTNLGKTTVSKVLGLFKKFEPKEKIAKPVVDKSQYDNLDDIKDLINKNENSVDTASDTLDSDKPKRPTSLLLNGLGRKNKYGRTASDSVSVASVDNDDQISLKKEIEPRNLRNTLKLDFSRLPRVKKIVPTNPVIEPQYINIPPDDKETNKIDNTEKNGSIPQGGLGADNADLESRSRSRSRSTISNSEFKSDNSSDYKINDKNLMSPSDNIVYQSLRNHESITPEKEDIVDRIRRKSFYSRFNEKKQRRKSNLVGPGATEYDPVARIHSPPTEAKYDGSPTSGTYDLSPAFSVASDISPSTERYRSLLSDLPASPRSTLRYDNYGLNDKIDTYRSLDRNEFRKYPGTRSYLDYDQPSSYGAHRYSRTKSLLDSTDSTEDSSLGILRDPHKYNRTISMYSPGNYATYRPKRTRNSAIILKESEKEPSPENILDKIRQRKKLSISVTKKPDTEDSLPRSHIPPKGEGDGAECAEKVD